MPADRIEIRSARDRRKFARDRDTRDSWRPELLKCWLMSSAKNTTADCLVVVRGEHGASTSPGARLPKSRYGYLAEALFRRDFPVVKSSYGTDDITHNFGRVSHGTKPGSGLPGAGWNDLGYRLAEFRDAHRRPRLSYFFQNSQARCFELGDRDFPHTSNLYHGQRPWSAARERSIGPGIAAKISASSAAGSSKMKSSPPPS